MTTASVLGRRACAVLAATSAALHGFSLVESPLGVITAVTAVMLVACLYCAGDLWAHASTKAWMLVALMNLAMIATHLPMPHGHQHGGLVGMPGEPGSIMMAATGLAAVEAIFATVVLFYRTRMPPAAVFGLPG